MKLGIFGGSFDPPHRGHLLLAECCLEQASLDEVWFVPTAHQPFKPGAPYATDTDRLAMLELAIADYPQFRICELELRRGGMSYTIDTLLHIRADHPDHELFLLMGADTLADFPYWRRPADICKQATPLVVARSGEPAPNFDHLRELVSEERLIEISRQEVKMPDTPISSTNIRGLIAAGSTEWQEMVPAGIATYIAENRLYQQTPPQT